MPRTFKSITIKDETGGIGSMESLPGVVSELEENNISSSINSSQVARAIELGKGIVSQSSESARGVSQKHGVMILEEL